MAESQGGDQLARDARIALPILGLLILIFVATAYRRFSGWGDPPPVNIRDATESADTDSNRTDSPIMPPVLRREPDRRTPSVVAPVASPGGDETGSPARLYQADPASRDSSENSARADIRSSLNPLSVPHPEGQADEDPAIRVQQGAVVEVTVDDSYWSICERGYGTGQYFRALYQYARDNPRLEQNLFPGRRVSLPTADELRRRYRDLCPAEVGPEGTVEHPADAAVRIYVTQGQETLFELSARFLGQAFRYPEILAANRDIMSEAVGANDRLPAGLRLRLPPR